MNMQDYKNAVDRIEISPDIRTEVLDMTTQNTRRKNISVTRIAAAAASFILVAGIGGVVGYAMLNANKVPADSMSAANSGTPERDIPNVPDLSAFGLDAAAFSPTSTEPMNVFERMLWVYKGDVPQFSVYEYTGGEIAVLMLDKEGRIVTLYNHNPVSSDAKIANKETVLETYLRALVPDYDSYEPLSDLPHYAYGGTTSESSLHKLYPNGMDAYAGGAVWENGSFEFECYDCFADSDECAYTRADYDAAYELTLNALMCAASDMELAGIEPEGRKFVSITSPEELEPEERASVDQTMFIRGDDGKIYGVYTALARFEDSDPQGFDAVPIIITPEMININQQGDEEDENTAAVYDFEQSMPKLFAYFEWWENLKSTPVDDTVINTTDVDGSTQGTVMHTTAVNGSTQTTFTTATVAPDTQAEEFAGLTEEQRTLRNDLTSVTLDDVQRDNRGDVSISLKYQVVLNDLELTGIPENVHCLPTVAHYDNNNHAVDVPNIDETSDSSVFGVYMGQDRRIYDMGLTYTIGAAEIRTLEISEFTLTYTLDGEMVTQKITGEPIRIDLGMVRSTLE